MTVSRTVLCTPLLHPAAIERGLWNREWPQVTYLERAIKGEGLLLDTDLPPPNTTLYPTLKDLPPFVQTAHQLGGLAVDLETAGPHMICAGLTAFPWGRDFSFDETHTLCLRFRLKGGELYWTRFDDQVEATLHLAALLGDLGLVKVFHNGVGFDVPYLLDLGFPIAGRWLDTMVMSHACYSELPKGLQFLATLHLGMPVWKTLSDPKDDEADEAAGEE